MTTKPDANTPPQRFRWKLNGIGRWRFGCCVYCATFELWEAHTFGAHDVDLFDDDPWESLGQLIGDADILEWIDNDMGWADLKGSDDDD